MGNCWSCGAYVSGLRYVFTCPACTQTAVMRDIRKAVRGRESAMRMIASGLSNVADNVSRVADELSNLAGIVQGGFDELNWELRQQTEVLLSIDQTLKTPSQTQAREWREMAEQLRSRDCFDEAEEWFLKALKMSPLDFRTYLGLAFNYLRKNDFDKAEGALTRSLPHAPQGLVRPYRESFKSPISQLVLKQASFKPPIEGRCFFGGSCLTMWPLGLLRAVTAP